MNYRELITNTYKEARKRNKQIAKEYYEHHRPHVVEDIAKREGVSRARIYQIIEQIGKNYGEDSNE